MKRRIGYGVAAVLMGILFALAFTGATLALRVPKNCVSINRVIDYVDKLAQRQTASAAGPAPQVADPEVQKLIDQSRAEGVEFRQFAARLSDEARCK